MLKNRSVASNFVKKTVQFLGFFLFRFPLRFKVLDLSVLCFLLNFIYDLTRKISVGLYIFICLSILSKMLNNKQYNNPKNSVGLCNEPYTDVFLGVFVGPHSSNVLLHCLHMHTHTILTAAAKSSIKGLFLPPPPLPPFQAYLMIFKDMSPYHVHAKYLFEIFSVNNCLWHQKTN